MHDQFKDMLGTDHLTFREGGVGEMFFPWARLLFSCKTKIRFFIGHERKISNFFLSNFNFKVWKLQEQIIIIFWHVLGQFKFFCIMWQQGVFFY